MRTPCPRLWSLGEASSGHTAHCPTIPPCAFLCTCAGMMFQLVLSEKLRAHLGAVAQADTAAGQPEVFASTTSRMHQIPGYAQSGAADNVRYFHGREIRKVPDAAGGMGFVLQLSHADEDDPEGWSAEERATYDGWGHDSSRTWRTADMYEKEGFASFKKRFGDQAFGLNHRCYWHGDSQGRLWLSAEDGCEGVYPAAPKGKPGWLPF